jgi:hypothetical protein
MPSNTNNVPEISVDFTYDMPDKYLYKTNELGLTADFTYTGPAKFWCYVNRQTGYVMPSYDQEAYDGTLDQAERWHQQGGQESAAILVDARKEPLLATLLWMKLDQADYPQTEFTRTDIDPSDTTVYYSRATIPVPDHTYEVGEIKYDFIANDWVKPFPWKGPHMTFEQLDAASTSLISEAGESIISYNEQGNTDMATKMTVFKEELEAIPTKFPRDTWDPWMIPFPQDPRAQTAMHPDDPPPGQLQVEMPIMPAEVLATAMDPAVDNAPEPVDPSTAASPLDTSTNT